MKKVISRRMLWVVFFLEDVWREILKLWICRVFLLCLKRRFIMQRLDYIMRNINRMFLIISVVISDLVVWWRIWLFRQYIWEYFEFIKVKLIFFFMFLIMGRQRNVLMIYMMRNKGKMYDLSLDLSYVYLECLELRVMV